MDREDIELSLENDLLTLKGKRKFEKEMKGKHYHQIERSYGLFSRSFSIPAMVNEDKVQADY